jgi:DNA-directed RNA polymerase subunit N (RpoN/RPB10)
MVPPPQCESCGQSIGHLFGLYYKIIDIIVNDTTNEVESIKKQLNILVTQYTNKYKNVDIEFKYNSKENAQFNALAILKIYKQCCRIKFLTHKEIPYTTINLQT